MSANKKPPAILLALLRGSYKVLTKTVKVIDVGEKMHTGSILAIYHQNFFILPKYRKLYALPGQKFTVMVSNHADGELVTTVVESHDIAPIRGDSLHEARSGLRAAYGSLQKKENLTVAVDGPVGPAKVIKPGALQMAKKTSAPLQMIMVYYARPFVFKNSWDKFHVAKPFSKAYTFVTSLYHYQQKISRDENIKEFSIFLQKEKQRFANVLQERGVPIRNDWPVVN